VSTVFVFNSAAVIGPAVTIQRPSGLYAASSMFRTAEWLPEGTCRRAHTIRRSGRRGCPSGSSGFTGVTFDAASRRIFTVALDGDVRVYNCRFCGDLEGVKKVARRKLAAFTRS